MATYHIESELIELIKKNIDSQVIKTHDWVDGFSTYMDSIKFMMLIPKIEERFDIEIEDIDLDFLQISNFHKLVDIIKKYLERKD
ncbi:MAG: hypothetical protein JXJ04_20025 [Spirochaetales bacterium]|nr:hypothetical protein [Spirochaetales bacterium]